MAGPQFATELEARLWGQLQAARGQLDTAKVKAQDLNSQIYNLNHQLRDYKEEAHNQVLEYTGQIDSLKQRLQTQERKAEAHIFDRNAAQHEVHNLDIQYRRLNHQLQSHNEKVQVQIKNLNSQIDSLHSRTLVDKDHINQYKRVLELHNICDPNPVKASLADLPSELLLQIADSISGTSRQTDFYNLSLVSRQLHPIGQEILHHSPSPKKPTTHMERSRVVCLARTLISRPDLARLVRTLDLSARWLPMGFGPIQPEVDWGSVITLCTDFLEGQVYANSAWVRFVRAGFETSICGVIIALVPALEELNVEQVYPMQNMDDDFVRRLGHQPSSFHLEHFFGLPKHGFNMTLIPGLSKLRCLSTPHFPPWQLTSLPAISSLKVVLRTAISGASYTRPFSMDAPLLDMPRPSEFPGISTLELEFEVGSLCQPPIIGPIQGHRIVSTLKSLPNLKYLCLRLTSGSDRQEDLPTTIFLSPVHSRKFLQLKCCQSLDTIIVDTSVLDERYDCNTKQNVLGVLFPLESLGQLPRLRRVVLPAETAYFFNTGLLSPRLNPYVNDSNPRQPLPTPRHSRLPASVESLEFIHPDKSFSLRISYFHCNEWCPHLKQVVLWNGPRSDLVPLGKPLKDGDITDRASDDRGKSMIRVPFETPINVVHANFQGPEWRKIDDRLFKRDTAGAQDSRYSGPPP